MLVELIYEKTCPNIEAARSQILRAFVEAAVTPQWREWEVSAADAPEYVHGYGSPTILVDGQDVSGDEISGTGNDYCCRVYSHQDEVGKGVPALIDIVQAIQSSSKPGTRSAHLSLNTSLLPAIGVAFLPKLACPACWPAYAGLLSSLGIGFVDYTPYLLPLTVLFLLIAIAALAYGAEQRRAYKPFQIGLGAAGILLVGKFYFDSDIAMYVGLLVLVAASIWNTWPKPENEAVVCSACEPTGKNNE